jgi:hypothetical protein
VITGFNTDVTYRGLVLHVQTEDKGRDNPLIETLIYRGGEILGSRRLPYTDQLKGASDSEKVIARLMEEQHMAVIQDVKRGRYLPAGEPPGEDLSLDEIVLAYLRARFGPA